MRLINVQTYGLETFHSPRLPKYAILSHRWGSEDEEPTCKDWMKGRKQDTPGYRKVIEFCSLCEDEGFEYAWCDTVCIDKSSSAELSEAINSMFYWYQAADLCYVFLHDVEDLNDLAASNWFTRGWTLQELLAPAAVSFRNKSWRSIGTKIDLKDDLSLITRISPLILEEPIRIQRASVAQRMSFASTRVCTRIEDEAYCLLGIFNVQMPLMYGEGTQAFARLQQSILEQSDDETIFAWASDVAEDKGPFSMLARSTYYFRDSGRIVRAISANQYDRPPWRMTNKGLEFCALSESWSHVGRSISSGSGTRSSRRRTQDATIHVVPLACAEVDSGTVAAILEASRVNRTGPISPCSVALTRSGDGNVYERVDSDTIGSGLESRYPKAQRHKALERKFYVRRLEYAPSYMSLSAQSSFASNIGTDVSDSAYGSRKSVDLSDTASSSRVDTEA